MAEFLSLQEGKVYRPATSRLARWMESARNDFYEKIEKLVDPQRVETGTYLNDIVACGFHQKDYKLDISSGLSDHPP